MDQESVFPLENIKNEIQNNPTLDIFTMNINTLKIYPRASYKHFIQLLQTIMEIDP